MQNSKASKLQVGSQEVAVYQKPIKNLHLSVLPPNGWVRVSAPLRMQEDEIRQMLVLKLPWIRKAQAKFARQARQTQREYVSGESHYFLGQRYRLEVVEKNEAPKIVIKGKNKIILQCRPNASVEKKREILKEWYRNQLKLVIAELIEKWQRILNVEASGWQIKEMKTRWGTCNTDTKHILFNLELAQKPFIHVDYIVLHELTHLIERTHNDKFKAILDTHLPKWRSIKDDLNRFILDYQDFWEEKENIIANSKK